MEDTRNIELIPKVYEKGKTDVVLDREFKEFGQPLYQTEEKSVEQFFMDYEELYFRIPAEGSSNSHQYLVEKSSEIYRAGSQLTDIQPLLDEINLLRSQSVVDQTTILELRSKLSEVGTAQ